MSNIQTLTSTTQKAYGKQIKTGTNKGSVNPNIHTLDTITQDEDDSESEDADLLNKAHELLTIYQEDLFEQKKHAIGLTCVIDEYKKRYNERGQQMEDLGKQIDNMEDEILNLNRRLELTKSTKRTSNKNIKNDFEIAARNIGRQVDDELFHQLKNKYINNFFESK
jgi:hypothetical protein